MATSFSKLAKGPRFVAVMQQPRRTRSSRTDSALLGGTGSHTVIGHWGHRKSGPVEPAAKKRAAQESGTRPAESHAISQSSGLEAFGDSYEALEEHPARVGRRLRRRRRRPGCRPAGQEGGSDRVRPRLHRLRRRLLLHSRHRHLPAPLGPRPARGRLPDRLHRVSPERRRQRGLQGRLRINLDARTQTAYGTLRAFVRLDAGSRTGGPYGGGTSGTQLRIGQAYAATGVDQFGRAQQYVNVDKAFIQFAGLTAGRASSFFDFYAHDFEFAGATAGSDIASTNLLAYTATLGNGFSATLSIEDPIFRRSPVFSPTVNAANVTVNGAITNFGLPSRRFRSSSAPTALRRPATATSTPSSATGCPTSSASSASTQPGDPPSSRRPRTRSTSATSNSAATTAGTGGVLNRDPAHQYRARAGPCRAA